ncbi:hypothetical protein GCM10023085_45350 [Actinomadura viridis]|uniref:Uncharacterized protein n=1 Tax=Actinomadura viridis TaxID=58110 RepID=A0A931DMM1_9ACTN|nr:hypothetical protein [Actinomadura viridis]MBG6089895.1 hypothetical protein [Actinomadura viridis]
MPFTAATRDDFLDDLDTLATHASLHTADPGTTGANEVTGGSPAYARKAITWNPSSAGSKTVTASVTFDVPAGTTVTHCGTWTGASGGTFRGGGTTTVESFGAQGTYTLNLTATLT